MTRLRHAAALVVLAVLAPDRVHAADATQACVAAANAGQQKQQSGKFLEARALLSRCSQPDCPAAIQADCGEWSMQLGARMPSLAFGVLDHLGNEVVDGTILLDGAKITTAPGLAVEMDPGVHEARATAPSGASATARFVAHEGERSRKIVLHLSRPAQPAPVAASRALPVAPLVVGGGGLALAGLGLGFVVAGAVSYGNLKSSCAPACSDDVVDSARGKSIAGDVLLGAGLVTLAAAGVWLFLASQHRASPAASITTLGRF